MSDRDPWPLSQDELNKQTLRLLDRIAVSLETLAEKAAKQTTAGNIFDRARVMALGEVCQNDDPAIREKSSPCILPKNHAGRKHIDDSGGEWLV